MRGHALVEILLVDDHPLFRDGFAQMARALRPDWTLRFSEDATRALTVLAEVPLDLVIIDVSLPGDDGFVLLKAVASFSAAIPQILISGRDDAAVRIRARACGARSFITKTAAPETIVGTIDTVLNGGTVFETRPGAGELPALTARQNEVLMLLAAGHGNKEIRHRLDIAERTVRAHLTELFQVLGAHSRMQAVIRARELGLID
jgi:DNA-binding NarL/FixJ family response regulator